MGFYKDLNDGLNSLVGEGKRFKTNADLARFCDVDPSLTHRHLKGKHGKSLEAISNVLDRIGAKVVFLDQAPSPAKNVHFVNAKVINAGEGLPTIIPDDYLAVPLCSEAGAGPGIVQYEEFQSWFLVYRNEPSIRLRSNLMAVKIAKGSTSMLPTLAPGDIVLVDRGENSNPRPGRMYLVAEPDGSTKVKRVKVDLDKVARQTRITFYSDNVAENPPEMFYLESDYEDDLNRAILGRVVWAWSDVSER